jgi:hypothetical protein
MTILFFEFFKPIFKFWKRLRFFFFQYIYIYIILKKKSKNLGNHQHIIGEIYITRESHVEMNDCDTEDLFHWYENQ